MRTTARWLLADWLLVALVVLGLDGRLPVFLAWATPSTLLLLGVGALVRQQLAPSILDQPPLPHRYRVADDLDQPIAAVVAAAEHEATTPLNRHQTPARPVRCRTADDRFPRPQPGTAPTATSWWKRGASEAHSTSSLRAPTQPRQRSDEPFHPGWTAILQESSLGARVDTTPTVKLVGVAAHQP